MPTENPRVNVTLSPSLDALVGQLAGLERISKASVLRELLETAEPQLRQVVALMVAAKGASATARKAIASDMETALRSIEGTSHLAMQVAANHTRDMVSEAEAVRGRRPQRGAQASPAVPAARRPAAAAKRLISAKRPPLSNRGVKS
jgi:hypothetical protein